MCLVDDNREKGNLFEICIDCILYLFDELDESYIMHLGADKLYKLCIDVFSWYNYDVMRCQKNMNVITPSDKPARLRELYRELFVNCGILPDRLEMQKPEMLFYALMNGQKKETADIPPQLRTLYGM